MKILNFGSLNMDRIYAVESFVRPGETITTLRFDVQPGGKGLNQSIAVARSGSEVYHAGKIGPDGAVLIDALEQAGVVTDFVMRDGSTTGHAIVQVNKYGNNCILLHGGANTEISIAEIDHVLANFNAGDFVILQNEINNLDYIIEKASQKYMRVALNPSPMNDVIKSLDLRKVTYLVLNELEGAELSGETRPTKILDYLLGLYPHIKIVLTLGRVGSLYADSLHRLQQGAFSVRAVDTTAAGDTFLGYFISRVAMGSPSWSAMRAGALAGALAVTKEGAAPSIPTWDEVVQLSLTREKEVKRDRSNLKIKSNSHSNSKISTNV
ncbi:MAG: ribokinase [Clostridiales bacterium]|jgi:ribokinase|nr:ribokinase [Clostridiales bacterium]